MAGGQRASGYRAMDLLTEEDLQYAGLTEELSV